MGRPRGLPTADIPLARGGPSDGGPQVQSVAEPLLGDASRIAIAEKSVCELPCVTTTDPVSSWSWMARVDITQEALIDVQPATMVFPLGGVQA